MSSASSANYYFLDFPSTPPAGTPDSEGGQGGSPFENQEDLEMDNHRMSSPDYVGQGRYIWIFFKKLASFKKSRPKKLVKSNKSISRKKFCNFKNGQIHFWTRKMFKTAKMQFHEVSLLNFLEKCEIFFREIDLFDFTSFLPRLF